MKAEHLWVQMFPWWGESMDEMIYEMNRMNRICIAFIIVIVLLDFISVVQYKIHFIHHFVQGKISYKEGLTRPVGDKLIIGSRQNTNHFAVFLVLCQPSVAREKIFLSAGGHINLNFFHKPAVIRTVGVAWQFNFFHISNIHCFYRKCFCQAWCKPLGLYQHQRDLFSGCLGPYQHNVRRRLSACIRLVACSDADRVSDGCNEREQ